MGTKVARSVTRTVINLSSTPFNFLTKRNQITGVFKTDNFCLIETLKGPVKNTTIGLQFLLPTELHRSTSLPRARQIEMNLQMQWFIATFPVYTAVLFIYLLYSEGRALARWKTRYFIGASPSIVHDAQLLLRHDVTIFVGPRDSRRNDLRCPARCNTPDRFSQGFLGRRYSSEHYLVYS